VDNPTYRAGNLASSIQFPQGVTLTLTTTP
jgi:hypothetical protein